MNGDLISRSVLLESMRNVVFENVPVEYQPDVQAACDAFEAVAKNVPAMDAEPVRHGRWEPNENRNSWYRDVVFCSECGAENGVRETKYCPNCGAKMEERQNV